MSKNIEVKAICHNFTGAEERIREITGNESSEDQQTDTYFCVHHGRFKLRESLIDGNYLIPYIRADESGPRTSDYAKIEVDDPAAIKDLFSRLLGTHIVIVKKRKVYMYENVRIHLDQVENLGSYIELEAVLDGEHNDPQIETRKVRELMKQIGIAKQDLVSKSYEALLRIKSGQRE